MCQVAIIFSIKVCKNLIRRKLKDFFSKKDKKIHLKLIEKMCSNLFFG
jgi:hypothetical protein